MRRWIVLISLPLLVAAFGFAFGLRSTSLAADPLNREVMLFAELQQQAAAGETWAQEAVARLESIAAARQLTVEELVVAGGEFSERKDEPIPIGAQGVRPFFVRLDAIVDLTTAANLDAYLEARRVALAMLVTQSPSSAITVSLGFTERPTIGEVLDLVRAHRGQVDQVLIDATVNGKRMFTQVMAMDEAASLTGLTNDDVVRRLTALVHEMEQPLCGAAAADIEWRVRAVRVSLAADDAAALAAEPAVLLVDPLDDVMASYQADAAEVNVGAWPNVTIASEELADKAVADAICQEGS